jgi:replication factor C small subunit
MLRFNIPSSETIETLVADIASKENVTIDEMAIKAIARESLGDLRRAINLLQIASTGAKQVTEDIVYEVSEEPLVRNVRTMVSHAFRGSFDKARIILRNLLAVDGFSGDEVSLQIQRELVKRPINPDLLARILERLAEIDYRRIQARNQFIQLTAFLASLTEFGLEESSSQS